MHYLSSFKEVFIFYVVCIRKNTKLSGVQLCIIIAWRTFPSPQLHPLSLIFYFSEIVVPLSLSLSSPCSFHLSGANYNTILKLFLIKQP